MSIYKYSTKKIQNLCVTISASVVVLQQNYPMLN